METLSFVAGYRKTRQQAFTLIEMIGVLAVLAILAATIIPNLLRKLDQVAGDQESAALKSIGDGLQASIMRNRYIPDQTNWISRVATELGWNTNSVSTNSRSQPRFFLINDAWTNSLPYQ